MTRLTLIMSLICLTASSMAMAEAEKTKDEIIETFTKKFKEKQLKCDKDQLENFKTCSTDALTIFSTGPLPETPQYEDNPKEEALYKAFRKCVRKYCPMAAY